MVHTKVSSPFAAAVGIVLSCAGCQMHPAAPPATAPSTQPATRPSSRLVGVWIADHLDPRSGDVQIKLVFEKRRHQHLLQWSELPLRGEAQIHQAPFVATDATIQSDALPGSTVPYHFDDAGQLILDRTDGVQLAFHRVR